VDFLDVVAHW